MSDPIATEPNIVHVSPEALLRETNEALEKISKKYPHVAFIVLVGPKSDSSALACLTTVPGAATIDRLRNGLDQAKRDSRRSRIIPFRG
jgi:hypothetical protein